jgi:hypothetical protein
VRTEYAASHPKHGVVEFWKDGICTRTATPTMVVHKK